MDRELKVMKGGYELAELIYAYERPDFGTVHIKVNRIYDLGDDMKSTYPIFENDQYFSHPPITSISGLKDFDIQLLKRQADFAEEFSPDLEYVYEPVLYRYLIAQQETIGIAEINLDFNENKRELKFLSARRQKEDISLSDSNSMQTNRQLLKYLCETYLDCFAASFHRIGWN